MSSKIDRRNVRIGLLIIFIVPFVFLIIIYERYQKTSSMYEANLHRITDSLGILLNSYNDSDFLLSESFKKEWAGRLDFDPQYAVSKREKAMLELHEISLNKGISEYEKIFKIATLASPPDSDIEVTEVLNNKHRCDIRFDLSNIKVGEEGSSTTFNSISELEEYLRGHLPLIIKDILSHFGKNVSQISIECTHGVRNAITRETEVTTIFSMQIDASKLIEYNFWSEVPLYRIYELATVTYNYIPNLEITTF